MPEANGILFLDCETSIYNNGHPFDPRNKLVSYVISFANSDPYFGYYLDPDFATRIRSAVGTCNVVVGFNIKFDLHWLRVLGILLPVNTKVWDLQLAEFILSGQEARFASLSATYDQYGIDGAKSHLIEDYWAQGISTEDVPIGVVRERGLGDVVPLQRLYEYQQGLMNEKQKALCWLEGEDLKALADAEWNGIKWDAEKATAKLEQLTPMVGSINAALSIFLPDAFNRSLFNWDSGDHLSAFLYGGTISFDYSLSSPAVYKSGEKKGMAYTKNQWFKEEVSFPQRFTPIEGTEVAKTSGNPEAKTRFYQTDAPTLGQLKARTKDQKAILELLSKRASTIKVSEMISSITKVMADKHWTDNLLHGQFNQNVVVTGRLSSSQPNMQNTPVEIDELLISRYDC